MGWPKSSLPYTRAVISSLMANWAKKVPISGGLSTSWGFCRLGGRYFKNRNAILCGIKFHTTQHQKFTSKYSYGSWTLFHSGDNRSEFDAILDNLPIKINVFSHVCILHIDLNWTDAGHNNANHQCNQQKRKNSKIIEQNEQRVRIWVTRCFTSDESSEIGNRCMFQLVKQMLIKKKYFKK